MKLSNEYSESYFDSRAPVIHDFEKFKKHIQKFQKNLKKIVHILNNIYYNRANFQCKILGGLSYTKMIKVGDLKLYTVHYTQIRTFVIFVQLKRKYFALKICTVIVYIIENVCDFFSDFFKTLNYVF